MPGSGPSPRPACSPSRGSSVAVRWSDCLRPWMSPCPAGGCGAASRSAPWPAASPSSSCTTTCACRCRPLASRSRRAMCICPRSTRNSASCSVPSSWSSDATAAAMRAQGGLDGYVYARAAAAILGLDRMREPIPAGPPPPTTAPSWRDPAQPVRGNSDWLPRRDGWLDNIGRGRGRSWLS